MNAATVDRRLESDLAASLDSDAPNVVRWPAKPEDDIDRLATYHRSRELKYLQHIADTRRAMRLADAGFDADDKAEDARHLAAKALTAERRANNREIGERNIAADEKLAAYNANAVADLTKE